ncbi:MULTISPECIES: hypothetical protein [Rhodomicrobium]|uniref:hypothetical protein n=1 Tax=Rhodomicrobium TaxID=1068 RepID=UPI000F74381A|nr:MULTISPECIES: hypothetical protein [Rhodomicrobium]
MPEQLRERNFQEGHFLVNPVVKAMFFLETHNRADWPLLRNSTVNLFARRQDHATAIAALDSLGYGMLIFRSGPEHFIDEMPAALKWRERFDYEPWSGQPRRFQRRAARRGEPFDTADDSTICIENFPNARGRRPSLRARPTRHYRAPFASLSPLRQALIALIHTEDKSFRCEGLGGRTVTSRRRHGVGPACRRR